jgi:hypothetical protein
MFLIEHVKSAKKIEKTRSVCWMRDTLMHVLPCMALLYAQEGLPPVDLLPDAVQKVVHD